MYYGNSTVTSPTENPTGVWDANHVGVWHLEEGRPGPERADHLYVDSTSNNDDDARNGTGRAGRIASGQQFDGTMTTAV